jgi:hypothetical protein
VSQGAKGRAGGGGRQKRKKPEANEKQKKESLGKNTEPPAVIDPDLWVVIRRPIRVQIVALGHQRLISPIEVAEAYGFEVKRIAEQFRTLVKAGFLELVEEVKVRGTVKHMYRSTQRAFVSDVDWSLLAKPIQDEWNGAFIHDLNARLADADEAGTLNSRNDRYLFWIALMLDELSWPEFVKMMAWATNEGKEIGAETVERHARDEGNGGMFPVTFAVMGFESPKESERKELKPGSRRRRQAPKGKNKKKKGKKGDGGKP